MINKPMTISSSVLNAAGPNKYSRIPSTISPTITQASKRVGLRHGHHRFLQTSQRTITL
jgi:hypothetical protein